MAVGTFAVVATLGPEFPGVPKLQQGVQVRGAFQINAPAAAPISATGTTPRHKLFTPEGNAAVSPLAADNLDFGFVNEHVGCCGVNHKTEWKPASRGPAPGQAGRASSRNV
jgi:hypothetical protein